MPERLEPEKVRRRDFLGIAGWLSAGIATLGSLLGMLRLPKPRVLDEVSSNFRIGSPADYPVGSDVIITERNVRVVSSAEGVAAMSLICTHLGCVVKRSEEGFSCPCHGSYFASDGKPVSGPAPRALAWFDVSQAADGSLVVDGASEVPPERHYQV